ncbi:hypothetical protein BDR22DRAFT_489277 [Usnea florida]
MPPKLVPKPPKPTLGAEPDLQSGEASSSNMLPKLAPKPTLGAEPDLQSYLPVVTPGNPMSPEQVKKAIGIFYWYKFDGRPMTRDEVQGMLSFKYRKYTHGNFLSSEFEILEKQVIMFGETDYEREIKNHKPDQISAEVDAIYNGYCVADEDAKCRRDILSGLKVRVPPSKINKTPAWKRKGILAEQLYCLFGLANWCKTDEGDLLPEKLVLQIFEKKMKLHSKSGKQAAVVKKLREPEDDMVHQVHGVLESHQDIRSHFENLALVFYGEHTGRKPPDPAEDAVRLTTTDFQGLTVTAGASGEEWSDLHDFDTPSASAESSGAGPSSPPKQITTINPRLLDKRRERESTESSSPGSGADPKWKGKGPDRKRPRGSGQGQK